MVCCYSLNLSQGINLGISASDQLQYPVLWAHRHTGSRKTKEKTTNEKVTALSDLATAL